MLLATGPAQSIGESTCPGTVVLLGSRDYETEPMACEYQRQDNLGGVDWMKTPFVKSNGKPR